MTHTYISLHLFYLNLKEEAEAIAETGKHLRFKISIGHLLAIIECILEGDGNSKLLGGGIFLKRDCTPSASQRSC